MIAETPPLGKSVCGTPWISHPHHFLLSLLPSEVDEDRVPNPHLKVSWPLPLSPAQRTPRLIRKLLLNAPICRTFCLPLSCTPRHMFLSGCTHMVLYVLPHTVSLLTIMGVGAEEAGVFFPHLLKPTPTPSVQSQSMARQGGGREGRTPTCALCPSQSTLSMSPRQQKKVMRTTPTMKGSEDPSPLCLMLSSGRDDPFGRSPWEVIKSAFIKGELLLDHAGLHSSSATH